MKLKVCTTDKIFGKICLKAIRDVFFAICDESRDGVRHEGKGEDSILGWGVTSRRQVRFKILDMSESPIRIPYKKHPEDCARPEYCINFGKSVREYIFYQSNKFTACKVRDGKGAAKFLMLFNLRKIIHPFKNKKYLRAS